MKLKNQTQLEKLKRLRTKLYNGKYSLTHIIEEILDILEAHLRGIE